MSVVSNKTIREYITAFPEANSTEVTDKILEKTEFADNDKRAYYREGLKKRVATLKNQQGIFSNEDAGQQILRYVQKKKDKPINLIDLCDAVDRSPGKVLAVIEGLKEKGFNINLVGEQIRLDSTIAPEKEAFRLNVSNETYNTFRFGAIGDNHLASRYERLDVLNAMYDLYEKEGIQTVFNTGNFIDGEARFNKHDLKVHGMDNQLEYFLEHYPRKEGIKTHYVTGDDHEGWYSQREGIDVGRHLERMAREVGRNDLHYLGHMERDVVLTAPNGQTVIRVMHPGGGSSYAFSYTVQKIVESLPGGEKPHILLVGHYHKAEYTYARGVHVLQTGCTEDQTPFMRKKRLAAHLGGWIFEFGTDENGAVTRFKSEWVPFYDKGYYTKKWEYQWK